MMFAQTSPTPATVYEFVMLFALVASIAGNIAMVLSARKVQKREVNFGFIPAAKAEFDKHVEENKREHENLFSKIGGVERGQTARMDAVSEQWRTLVDKKMGELLRSNDEGRQRLHERIDEILGAVSELRGEMRARRGGSQ